MARPRPNNNRKDTRRRSRPNSLSDQRTAIKSDFQTQLAAEKERWHLIGGLVRMWVRQALGLPGNDQGLKLYFDQMEDGFERIVTYDPKQKIIGWDKGNRPVLIRLNKTATYVPLEDGKAIFAERVAETEDKEPSPVNKLKSNKPKK